MRALFLFALCSVVAFAQSTSSSNSVTVTASRATNVQPDQVVFSVQVSTGLDGTLDSAVNALQGSGITASNFTSVSLVQVPNGPAKSQNVLSWSFSLTVAFSDMKATIGLLSAVQQSNGTQNNGISISFSVAGTAVSPQAQQAQQCSQTDLLSDARAQAQKLASAAGKGVGSVLSMSGGVTTSTQTNGLVSSSASSPSCSLTVKFQLTGI